MHIRPFWFLGPKMKDFKKSGVEFKIKGAAEGMQGITFSTVRLEKRFFSRSGVLHANIHDNYGRTLMNTYGAGAMSDPTTIPLQVRKTLTGRIRYIDPSTGKEHKLRIVG